MYNDFEEQNAKKRRRKYARCDWDNIRWTIFVRCLSDIATKELRFYQVITAQNKRESAFAIAKRYR